MIEKNNKEKQQDMNTKNWLNDMNVHNTQLNPEIDPLDTLQRIASAWLAIDLKCNCGPPPAACDICETRYLLEEALVVPQWLRSRR